jgi:CDGSH-type Zn-finger protein
MEKPISADNKPMLAELIEGKTYAWCACGKSKNQPWCDGSHKGTGLAPKIFKVEDNKKAAMCMCKKTSNPGFCDGSHAK